MDLNKKKRYDEMIEETKYVIDKFPYRMDDVGITAAILVAAEHSNEDLGQLAGFIHNNTVSQAKGTARNLYQQY